MSHAIAPTAAPQQIVASSYIHHESLPVAATGNHAAASPAPNRLERFTFLASGALLAAVSITLAGLAGWQRGITLPEHVTWAVAGAALAAISLSGLAVAFSSRGTRRALALLAWGLGLLFTITAGLGSQHGGRELASRADSATTGERARLERAYSDAASQLSQLPAARPSAVVQGELTELLKDERLKSCATWVDTKRLRVVCAEQVAPRRAELANAEAREKAQTAMSEASAALSRLSVSKPASADATAIGRYLALVGVTLTSEQIADWLNLLTVLALEVCGSVSLALGRRPSIPLAACAVAPAATSRAVPVATGEGGNGGITTPADLPKPLLPSPESERRQRVIDRLKVGALEGRQIDIAAELNLPITSMRRIAETTPGLRLSRTETGSKLELVAA